MYFKQMLNERCGCASYIVASRTTGEAAIIDPARDIGSYDELLVERGYTLKYVIDTHVHADHISGARELAATHDANLCLHESARVSYPFRALHDGQLLALGPLQLMVIHTPGHRPELVSLLVSNPQRGAEPSMVLTGDSLLVGDVGRPDFAGGDASAQYRSIQRLLELPDWMALFPGHFEGPCGGNMCGRPSSTIGFERRFNPMLRLDQASFVQRLTGEIPPRPLNLTAIEATNRGEANLPWAMLESSAPVEQISVHDAATRIAASFVLDVREPEEYDQGRIPCAVNVPQADLALRLNGIPRNQPVLCVCQAGRRSLQAARFLEQVGFTDVASLAGGTNAWIDAGRPVNQAASDGEVANRVASVDLPA